MKTVCRPAFKDTLDLARRDAFAIRVGQFKKRAGGGRTRHYRRNRIAGARAAQSDGCFGVRRRVRTMARATVAAANGEGVCTSAGTLRETNGPGRRAVYTFGRG